eukprot:985292_1
MKVVIVKALARHFGKLLRHLYRMVVQIQEITESWAFITTVKTVTSSGQTVKEQWGVYDSENKGRLFGSNNNPNRPDVWVASYIYGECVEFYPGTIWIKQVGCTLSDDGKDVLRWEWFSDKACTKQLPENDWIDFEDSGNWFEGGDIQLKYSKNIEENTVYQEILLLPSKKRILISSQDTVCYVPPVPTGKQGYTPPLPYYNNHYISPYQFTDHDSGSMGFMGAMAVNILVSVVSSLCVIGVCFCAFLLMKKTQKNHGYGGVHVPFDKEMDFEA